MPPIVDGFWELGYTKAVRKLGIDYGEARIGIAVSDPMGIIASPLAVYERKGVQADLDYLRALIAEREADTVVFGLPLNMDGTESDMSRAVRTFAGQLKCGARVVFMDERWTSRQSERIISEERFSVDKKKKLVDKIAAQLILQAYLDGGN